jgi:DNA-binding transcriptional ArsR family regulator
MATENPEMTPEEIARADRKLDFDGLKGLAHPLRVTILDRLSVHGPATASGLAEALGESSGATSYHLRQLERHGFVREVQGKGTGRERWWERMPGGISLSPEGRAESEAARSASDMIMRQWESNRSVLLNDFLANGERVGEDWILSSLVSTANLRLTLEQAQDVQRRLENLIDEIVTDYQGSFGKGTTPGARPVQLHINLFPVVDGVPTPEPIADPKTDPVNDGGRP